MAKTKSKTNFERFFSDGEWDRLLERTHIPHDHMLQPVDVVASWDRRAAWLVFNRAEVIDTTVKHGAPIRGLFD